MRSFALATFIAIVLAPTDAWAIRPFVTDDAHTVGKGHLQLETYWRHDRKSLQHWILPAFGPNDWLELTLGGVHGLGELDRPSRRPIYGFGGPIPQAKFLLRDGAPNELPGVGLVVGGVVPAGRGGFEAPGWSGFTYLAMTQAFFKEDDFLIHANVGVSTLAARGYEPAKITWGIGTQVETLFNVHLIGELFSGDPYVQGGGGAYQAGFRIIFNDNLQLDATWGGGIWGDERLPVWFSSGVRIVSNDLF